jgi:hypothetical protein
VHRQVRRQRPHAWSHLSSALALWAYSLRGRFHVAPVPSLRVPKMVLWGKDGMSGQSGMLPAVVRMRPQPPLHGRRAGPRVVRRKHGEDSGPLGSWRERPAWAHQLVPNPSQVPRIDRLSARPAQPQTGKPMFTLRTQVNLRRSAVPRPYRQTTVQPTSLPLSDTIVLANLERRQIYVAPPKCVTHAIESWGAVWNTPRVHQKQVRRIMPSHRCARSILWASPRT